MDVTERNEPESNPGQVMESLGVPPQDDMESEKTESKQDELPIGFLKELKRRDRKYQRDVGALQDQIQQLHSQLGNNSSGNDQRTGAAYTGQPAPSGSSIEEQIQRGVQYALQSKDMEEQKRKQAEQMQHVEKQYGRLHEEFDKAGDKYDDFDEVVRHNDAPFTPALRDALLLVDNPAEVAYKLGKDRDKLRELGKLHPLDQAREIYKLSYALMNGNKASNAPSSGSNVMGNIRVNPANSTAVTDKTPASSIRARMKAGTWK